MLEEENSYQYILQAVDGSRFFNLCGKTRIEYHPSIDYPPQIFQKFSVDEKAMLYRDSEQVGFTPSRGRGNGGGNKGYRSNNEYSNNKRKIQQLEQKVWELRSQASH